jgi:hypothetical protein
MTMGCKKNIIIGPLKRTEKIVLGNNDSQCPEHEKSGAALNNSCKSVLRSKTLPSQLFNALSANSSSAEKPRISCTSLRILCNNCHKLASMAAVTPHFSYMWAALENFMAMFRDNECAYSGKYDALKTIFDRRCHLTLYAAKIKQRPILGRWRYFA